jgi:1-acyl-sn-glycerol-3-phosphate acyltransferase
MSDSQPGSVPRPKRPSARRSASEIVETPSAPPAPPPVEPNQTAVGTLLSDIHGAEHDADAARRAAETLSRIATRIGAEDDVRARANALLPTAKQYLSADYYLQQWSRIGMRNRSERVDDFGLDLTYEASARPVLEALCDKYFRIEVEGAENIPAEGRVLLIGNHSGTLPWDGLMLRTALRKCHPAQRASRWLVEDHVFHAPFLGALLNRLGAVRACQENAQRLLESEELVAVFPEGIKGIAKRYSDRYKLQRFGRGGYVKLALRTGAPVIPIAIVGAEETYPLLYMVKAFSKALGLPFFPVTPTFPLLGPLGLAPLPSRWRIVIGKPVIELQQHGPDGGRDEVLVGELNERVRAEVTRLLEHALAARGSRVFV